MIAALIALQLAASAIERPEGLRLQATRVIDGDTLRETKRTQDYRLHGIDAPETLRAKCDTERTLGQAAAARVAGLLATAEEVRAFPAHDPRGRNRWPVDGFGRRLARIEVDGQDIGAILLAEGLAKPYSGGTHPDWCAE